MAEYPLFENLPEPGGLPRTPSQIMDALLKPFELAPTAQVGKRYGITVDTIKSEDRKHTFEIAEWKYNYILDYNFCAVDREPMRGGTLLIAHAMISASNETAVHIFEANNVTGYKGLKRIRNDLLPRQTAQSLIQSTKRCTAKHELNPRPSKSQLVDLAKALATLVPEHIRVEAAKMVDK